MKDNHKREGREGEGVPWGSIQIIRIIVSSRTLNLLCAVCLRSLAHFILKKWTRILGHTIPVVSLSCVPELRTIRYGKLIVIGTVIFFFFI